MYSKSNKNHGLIFGTNVNLFGAKEMKNQRVSLYSGVNVPKVMACFLFGALAAVAFLTATHHMSEVNYLGMLETYKVEQYKTFQQVSSASEVPTNSSPYDVAAISKQPTNAQPVESVQQGIQGGESNTFSSSNAEEQPEQESTAKLEDVPNIPEQQKIRVEIEGDQTQRDQTASDSTDAQPRHAVDVPETAKNLDPQDSVGEATPVTQQSMPETSTSQSDQAAVVREFPTHGEQSTTHFINCGTRESPMVHQCHRGSLSVVEYVGDSNLPEGVIFGKSQEFKVEGGSYGNLFSSKRGSDDHFGYLLPVKPGRYFVKLHFLELGARGAGERVMDVFVNDAKVLENLDVFATCGPLKPFSTVPTLVDGSGGTLSIKIAAVVGKAMCSGIDVYPEGYPDVASLVQQLSKPLPFKSVCSNHDSPDKIDVVGPTSQKLELKALGQMAGGPQIYRFEPADPGKYKILEGDETKEEVLEFSLNLDRCSCPMPREEFSTKYGCSETVQRTAQSLFDKWKESLISLDDFTNAASALGQQSNLRHVAIVNNELHVKTLREENDQSEWTAFSNLLLSLLRKVNVEDVEFYWHSNGTPALKFEKTLPPLLGSLYNPEFSNIPVPNKQAIDVAFLHGGHLVSLSHLQWDLKINKAFFRGTVVSGPGDNSSAANALRLTSQSPSLFDINLASSEISTEERSKAFDHTLVLELNANPNLLTAAEILSSGCVLVQQKRADVEWYQLFLQENVHFLPLEESLEDIVKVVKRALFVGDKVNSRAIAMNGIALATEHLSQEAIFCWVESVLHGLKGALGFTSQIREGMVAEMQPGDACSCA